MHDPAEVWYSAMLWRGKHIKSKNEKKNDNFDVATCVNYGYVFIFELVWVHICNFKMGIVRIRGAPDNQLPPFEA